MAAFLAVASSAAGFAGLLQLMFVAFAPAWEFWVPLFAALSVLTMTVGNLVALQQRQLVRLLAYSGIAQSGYILLPFALVSENPQVNDTAFAAAVSYILIYGIMNIGAFAVATAVSRRHPKLLISDFNGLVKIAPVIAVGMTAFMVSLAGIPPTAGFWAKLFVFRAAIDRGGLGVALAVIMLVNSVVSIYYYFAVPRADDLPGAGAGRVVPAVVARHRRGRRGHDRPGRVLRVPEPHRRVRRRLHAHRSRGRLIPAAARVTYLRAWTISLPRGSSSGCMRSMLANPTSLSIASTAAGLAPHQFVASSFSSAFG